ncbi:carboxypeptidase-like regulatory domain-containing protein [Flavobacterium sp.]|uniref:carboxypeptidase-like regulatory domain-containing protein n=1 Tax=Flavobacterium sp. TaxID=239 RepID=UPI0025EC159D|nr:carboxypeptidase-like regulatory domain-containing protein [Flavobacterium sp.]
MKENRLLWLMLLMISAASAQIKGIVIDENNKPIPYVNIGVENENVGTTSEENGTFFLNVAKTKSLVFSALGYEKKTINGTESQKVILKEAAFKLDEVVIAKRFETRELEIGKVKIETYQAFDNGPRIDAKFFPYILKYKKTKFIKKVAILTDCQIENATIKIHFYSVSDNGFPGKELQVKDFLVSVKKGVKKTFYDVTDLNLRMPKTGIFIGYEKLIIEKNKLEKTIIDSNTNTTILQKTYYPFMLYNYVHREFIFTFYGGKWNKQTKQDINNPSDKMMVYEPAINLILTN